MSILSNTSSPYAHMARIMLAKKSFCSSPQGFDDDRRDGALICGVCRSP
jgi:hypothetical protein